MKRGHYILTRDKRIKAVDLLTWATDFEYRMSRIVRQEYIGRSWVSTVFLGLDHNWGDGPPVLWETMVFGGKLDQEQDRCSGGYEQAEAMHAKWVERAQEAEGWRVTVYGFVRELCGQIDHNDYVEPWLLEIWRKRNGIRAYARGLCRADRKNDQAG